MKKLSIVLSLVAAFGLAVVACGDDDDKNACEKAADVMVDGMDSYCDGKSDECYYCDCYNQGLVQSQDATDQCEEPTNTGSGDGTCDGSSLASAQDCLDDEAACRSIGEAAAQAGCDFSQK